MTNVSTIDSPLNNMRRSAIAVEQRYQNMLGALQQTIVLEPNHLVFHLAAHLLGQYLGIASKHWVAATDFRLKIEDPEDYGVTVNSILLGQEKKLVVEFTSTQLGAAYIGPTTPWGDIIAIRDHWTTKYAEVVQPMSMFIYAAIQYFEMHGWRLVQNKAVPGDEKFDWVWLDPSRTYLITMKINYSTLHEDGEMLKPRVSE